MTGGQAAERAGGRFSGRVDGQANGREGGRAGGRSCRPANVWTDITWPVLKSISSNSSSDGRG